MEILEITVMTYNIHHGKGSDKISDLNRIAEVIKKSKADIIGLNEVDKHLSKRSNYVNQVEWLAKQLNMYQIFSPSISIPTFNSSNVRQYGNALLSSYPIVNHTNFSFNFIPGLVEGRSLLEATIEINKKLFRIYVTHLSLNTFLHRKQTDFIINLVHKCSHPIIIMGDWNMRTGSHGWKKITRELHDVWDQAGNGEGFTYPSLRPRRRLDYLFVSSSFRIDNVELVTLLSKASDHLPLKATLTLD
ncbi:endonuclease/exonuclease/phosphatase family protein [Heyndrickxia sp. NPDC080065]|uniref:endonuclease/exonuclease/phosphatase family protein n=1 Tax=Heyndrickxia sp. NPDC080065 TaxID=3390568 RepID=UPI003D034E92